ncbi:MAG: hypothetical protein UW66_C0056G0012 [Candidatus Moranbacteria bacterium GW2011_GWF1_44_4]|nr:MAG: hypothetical protein UW66_C0056G0012 [Candidatus Moranbacteria bacterium GW2011_GWF1_44_4]
MNADLFLLGTLLPDVRRVTDEVKRKDTHVLHEELNLEFHGAREDILNKHGFYSLKYTTALDSVNKLLEDELVYEKYQNWEKLRWLLNNPPEIKTGLDVAQETIGRWYAILAKYFEKKPDEKTMRAFLWKQRKLRGQIGEIIDALKKLRENKKAVEILSKVSEEILE